MAVLKRNTLAIIGNEYQTLPVIRCFARAGYDVHVFSSVDEYVKRETLSTRFIKKANIHIYDNPDCLMVELRALKHDCERIKVIITSATELTTLRLCKPTLWSEFDLISPSLDVVNMLADKVAMYSYSASVGMDVLPFIRVCDYTPGAIQFPVVLKRSVERYNLLEYKCVVINDAAQLNEVLSTLSDADREDLILQKCANDGFEDLDLRGYAHNGTLIGSLVLRKLRAYPAGVSSYLEEVESQLAEEVVTAVSKLLANTGYTGFYNVDIKYDIKNRVVYAIDVNPRTPASVDVWFKKFKKKDLVDFAKNIDTPQPMQPKCGTIKWVSISRDIYARMMSHDWTNITQFISAQKEFWDNTDPIPFFAYWFYVLKRKIFMHKCKCADNQVLMGGVICPPLTCRVALVTCCRQ
jgi:predicted ATP-grasp superfamily ATP-dependent carboligase